MSEPLIADGQCGGLSTVGALLTVVGTLVALGFGVGLLIVIVGAAVRWDDRAADRQRGQR
jgi:hypothetical protein